MLDTFFNSESFSVTSLSKAMDVLPYKPGRMGQLGLFETKGVDTISIVVEYRNGILELIPVSQWGGPAPQARSGGRNARPFLIPHLQLESAVMAADVIGRRKFGSEDEMEVVEDKVNEKLTQLKQSHELTLEYHRMGAIRGVVYDADGSTVLTNFFTEFGIAETVVDFNLDSDTSDLKAKALEVLRAMDSALGGLTYDHVHAMCSNGFFDAFTSHDAVKNSYERFQENQFARTQQYRNGFEWGDIVWENYRGQVGSIPFVPADTCRFFPVGVPGLFQTAYAPADFIETVNTIGIPYYAKSEALSLNRGMKLHSQSNPFNYCILPSVLIKGIKT
jgi:hypothetical protein